MYLGQKVCGTRWICWNVGRGMTARKHSASALGQGRRAMRDARLIAPVRRRWEGRRSNVLTVDHLSPVAMHLKRIRAAGGMIVAVRSRAADIVGMLEVIAFE